MGVDVGWDLSKYLLPEAKASHNCCCTDRLPVSSLTIKQDTILKASRSASVPQTYIVRSRQACMNKNSTERDLYLCMSIQYHTFAPLTCACSSDPLEPD